MLMSAHPRIVIVCLSAGDSSTAWVTVAGTVAGHSDTTPVLRPLFAVRRRLRALPARVTAAGLLGSVRRRGLVTRAAGGKLGRLDLAGTGQQGWLEATARWALWRQVSAGLKTAAPWQVYLRRHQQSPDKLSLAQVRQAFVSQPAVAAMLAHNAVPGSQQLDPYELDAYAAGQRAYATCHMLAATCGHAMLTSDGTWLQPDSSSFTDRLTYLRQAAAHLHQLPRSATVLALAT